MNVSFTALFEKENSLRTYIKKNKIKRRGGNKSGVYKITCGSCPEVYIVQTEMKNHQNKMTVFLEILKIYMAQMEAWNLVSKKKKTPQMLKNRNKKHKNNEKSLDWNLSDFFVLSSRVFREL